MDDRRNDGRGARMASERTGMEADQRQHGLQNNSDTQRSLALDVGPPLKILLVGQEALRATIKRAQHADLLNRVSVRFQLRALTKEQTSQYVDFQITQAGGTAKLFGEEVKALLHDFTGGLPRAINNLAIACLLQATALGVTRIDEDVFRHAAAEFQLA